MQAIASVFPIYYGADALRDAVLREAEIPQVAQDMAILWAFIAAFFGLSCISFRKKQARLR